MHEKNQRLAHAGIWVTLQFSIQFEYKLETGNTEMLPFSSFFFFFFFFSRLGKQIGA